MRYASSEDDARDYMNVGFFKILTNLKKYNPKAPFIAWSKRVMINATIDEMRRHKRYKSHVMVGSELPPEPTPIIFSEKEISADDIYRYIQSLPPMTASVFNLFAIDGYKHREIAKLLKISEGTSKWHYSRAKERLRSIIQAHSSKRNAKSLEKVLK